MKTLQVSAGGRGERIASYITSIKPFLPKHLLPIPTDGKTILGEISFAAQKHFDEVKIWASKETYPQISLALSELTTVKVLIDAEMTGPLGPLIRGVISARSRTFGCAGDFYCDFSWADFEKFHENHGQPISILTTKSVAAPEGARFQTHEGIVQSWERAKETSGTDLINIGCYIIDPTEKVLHLLKKLQKHKEDTFFEIFVSEKLVAGYDPGVLGFNVNVAEIYEKLLHALA